MDTERLLGVQGGACTLRELGDQLEVGEGCQCCHGEGEDERQPGHTADVVDHAAGHRVDACAENVADDEQQEQLGAHHPFECGRFALFRSGINSRSRHRQPSVRRELISLSLYPIRPARKWYRPARMSFFRNAFAVAWRA